MKNLSTLSFVKLFNVPISIINESKALALIGEWLREYRSVIGSLLPASPELQRGESVVGSESAGFQSAGSKPITGFPKIITTPNPEIIVAAQSDPELMKALRSADLAIPDGIGIVWAINWLGKTVKQYNSGTVISKTVNSRTVNRDTDLPDYRSTEYRPTASPFHRSTELSRLSGLDLMESLISEFPRTLLQGLSSKESPWKVMLLGGRPGVAQKAAKKLSSRFGYQFSVVGFQSQVNRFSVNQSRTGKPKTDKPETENRKQKTDNRLQIRPLSGPQNISTISKSENNRLIAQINSFQPDLLFAAFGHPRQEKWLMENRERLTAGVAMAVGGALDQIANPSLRPPPYINSIGLGWLYRLLRQPWRWKRQLALIKFVLMVAKDLLS